ncbi:C4b-binding protein alpha chain-like [Discoglossus pictus]
MTSPGHKSTISALKLPVGLRENLLMDMLPQQTTYLNPQLCTPAMKGITLLEIIPEYVCLMEVGVGLFLSASEQNVVPQVILVMVKLMHLIVILDLLQPLPVMKGIYQLEIQSESANLTSSGVGVCLPVSVYPVEIQKILTVDMLKQQTICLGPQQLFSVMLGSCPDPPRLSFASADIDSNLGYFDVGVIIEYKCNVGYASDIFNTWSITCQKDFTWTQITEFCNMSCGSPELIENGYVQTTDNLFGSTVDYTCEEGVKDKQLSLAGCKTSLSMKDVDQDTGEDFNPNRCRNLMGKNNEEASLRNPERPSHLSLVNTPGMEDETIERKCLTNIFDAEKGEIKQMIAANVRSKYVMVGTASRVCLANGQWSGSVPICKKTCPEPPTLPFAEIIGLPEDNYYPVGIYITYKCLPGYKLDFFQPSFIRCQTNAAWTEISELCKKIEVTAQPSTVTPTVIETTLWTDVTMTVPSLNLCEKISAAQEDMRKCTSAPDEWAKYLEVQYLYLQIENLKLDLENKKKEG